MFIMLNFGAYKNVELIESEVIETFKFIRSPTTFRKVTCKQLSTY